MIIDFPFDEAGHGPRDDIAVLDQFKASRSEGAKTLCWVPSFFSPDAQKDLGMLVILEHILMGERFGTYLDRVIQLDSPATVSSLLQRMGWWKPEAAEKPHVLHSLSMSFCSTAVGLAVAEGKLSIDDPVLKFFPEDAPDKPSDKLKQMRVRDLLTMSTGHETEPKFTADDSWVQTFLAHPVPHQPGAHFQ